MKLQLIELSGTDILEGTEIYRYILEINERFIISTKDINSKLSADEAYKDITQIFLNSCHDFNLEHYRLLGIIPELDMKVIMEQEVADTYLKDLYIESRIKDLEGDFS